MSDCPSPSLAISIEESEPSANGKKGEGGALSIGIKGDGSGSPNHHDVKGSTATATIVIQHPLGYRYNIMKQLNTVVLAYAALFLVVKGLQFGCGIKTSLEMVLQNSKSPPAFSANLNQETSRIVWKSLYELKPEQGSSVSAADGDGASMDSSPGANWVENEAQTKSDVHIWNTYLTLHCLEYLYAWLLVISVKYTVPLGILIWLAFAAPVACLSLVQIVTDILLGDFFHRGIIVQAELGIEILLRVSVILMALLYFKETTKDTVMDINAAGGSPIHVPIKSNPQKPDLA